VVVEWGDLQIMGSYPVLMQFGMKLIYRFADAVWFKEPYMQSLLDRHGARRTFFIPNTVGQFATKRQGALSSTYEMLKEQSRNLKVEERSIDFLWANRLIEQRRPSWLIPMSFEIARQGYQLTIMGFRDEDQISSKQYWFEATIRTLLARETQQIAWGDPRDQFRQSRYFLLFGERIFGNHALLEAMSQGVVPLVTQSESVEAVVQDSYNGFVAELDLTSVLQMIKRAMSVDENEWIRLSQNAVATVASRFSYEQWRESLLNMYAQFD